MAKKTEVRLTENQAIAAKVRLSAQPLDERFEQIDIPETIEQPIPGYVRCKVIESIKNHAPGDPVLVKFKDMELLAGSIEEWDGTTEDFDAGMERLAAAAEIRIKQQNENNKKV